MNNIGRVVEIKGKTAVVEVRRASACGENCAMCKASCLPTEHRAIAENRAGAAPGDLVRVEMPAGAVLSAAMLVYLVPLALLFAGYGVAESLFHNTAASIAAALAGLAVGFGVVRLCDRRVRRLPVITKVISGK